VFDEPCIDRGMADGESFVLGDPPPLIALRRGWWEYNEFREVVGDAMKDDVA